ncbi:MAG TPA: glycosyltransferase family 2 protein [Steroidobacteraceae bacterium]|nr:glycosyltransferase family 2 protein [Steroidobacteraceae bacterium]
MSLASSSSPAAGALFRPCAVIPVYNHERAVGKVVAAVRDAGLPCVLVDDASGPECARELDRLAAADPDVSLVRLSRNLGKGGAVTAGLRAARASGFSHALQIDADGQHALGDVSRFIDTARAHPDALVCGRPIFGDEMPRGRFYSRYLTHWMVWLNTLSFAIPDSMCGFRVYPLAPVLELLNSTRLGSRMDFDVEVLVRLNWRGQPMLWLPTRVSYPLDGVSHFRLVWDNVLMVRLQLMLFAGMLIRLPLLLWRKIR